MSRLVDTFCDMVRISSESGQEAQFIAYMNDLFSSSFDATCTTDGYGNLVAKIPAKGSTVEEPVLFGVHGDTVKPGQDIEPVLENGIIRSKGETILGADDKAGIAELVEAIETAGRCPRCGRRLKREIATDQSYTRTVLFRGRPIHLKGLEPQAGIRSARFNPNALPGRSNGRDSRYRQGR